MFLSHHGNHEKALKLPPKSDTFRLCKTAGELLKLVKWPKQLALKKHSLKDPLLCSITSADILNETHIYLKLKN